MNAMTISKDQLKPCPFCGEEPWFEGDGDNWQDDCRYVEMEVVCCVRMSAALRWNNARNKTIQEREQELKEELLQMWNTRFVSVEEKPWYPDDSGEWVEYDGENRPEPFALVDCLLVTERNSEILISCPMPVNNWNWNWTGSQTDIVAYKVVQ